MKYKKERFYRAENKVRLHYKNQ